MMLDPNRGLRSTKRRLPQYRLVSILIGYMFCKSPRAMLTVFFFILFQGNIFAGLCEPGALAVTKKKSLANHFATLASQGRLKSQAEKDLGKQNLLIDGGGLCGPTCALNIRRSISSYLGITEPFLEYGTEFISQLLRHQARLAGNDPRMGTRMLALKQALQGEMIIPDGERIRIESEFLDLSQGIRPQDLAIADNELKLLMIAVGKGPSGNALYHFVVLLRIDEQAREIHFSDPNRANVVSFSAVAPAQLVGVPTMQLEFYKNLDSKSFQTTEFSGMVVDILSVKVHSQRIFGTHR